MGVDGFRICFEILFPTIYKTKEEAESNNGNICAYMEKDKVVIKLYEYHILVQTIYRDEWWKYKCCRIKNKSKNALLLLLQIMNHIVQVLKIFLKIMLETLLKIYGVCNT